MISPLDHFDSNKFMVRIYENINKKKKNELCSSRIRVQDTEKHCKFTAPCYLETIIVTLMLFIACHSEVTLFYVTGAKKIKMYVYMQ